MSALPITPPEPAETPRVPGSRITRRLGWINGFITRSNDELADETHIVTAADLAALDRTARRLEATRVTLIAKADRQRTFTLSGSSSTSSWVATTTRVGGSAAAGQVALASALEDGLGATKEALTAGQVSVTSAGIITTTMRELPEGLTETERASVETALVKDAERLDPGRLRRAATSALAAAHRSVEEVAEHQERVLADQERRAYARSFITMFDQGDGTTTGRFLVPTGTAKVLGKVLQSMTAPGRDHLRTGASPGSPNGTGSLASLDGTGSPDRAPSSEAGPAGQVDAEPGTVASGLPERNDDWAALSWAEKKGRAFAHLLEHLPTDQLTGRTASTVVITMTLEQVLGAAEAARLAAQMTATTGHQISLTPTSARPAPTRPPPLHRPGPTPRLHRRLPPRRPRRPLRHPRPRPPRTALQRHPTRSPGRPTHRHLLAPTLSRPRRLVAAHQRGERPRGVTRQARPARGIRQRTRERRTYWRMPPLR